jgi:hypothetical protein
LHLRLLHMLVSASSLLVLGSRQLQLVVLGADADCALLHLVVLPTCLLVCLRLLLLLLCDQHGRQLASPPVQLGGRQPRGFAQVWVVWFAAELQITCHQEGRTRAKVKQQQLPVAVDSVPGQSVPTAVCSSSLRYTSVND